MTTKSLQYEETTHMRDDIEGISLIPDVPHIILRVQISNLITIQLLIDILFFRDNAKDQLPRGTRMMTFFINERVNLTSLIHRDDLSGCN